MRQNTQTIIIISLILILGSFIAGLLLGINQRKNKVPTNTSEIYINSKTDTVISKQQLKELVPYPTETKPTIVTIYQTPKNKIDTCYLKGDTVFLATKDSLIKYNNGFLTNFTSASKLIDMKLKGHDLTISLLTPQGNSLKQLFKIDPLKYNYIYSGNKLTLEPTNKWYQNITIYGELVARPIVRMYDINLGVDYKTNNIIIDGGVNFGYLYNLPEKFIATPFIRTRYNLPWPRK